MENYKYNVFGKIFVMYLIVFFYIVLYVLFLLVNIGLRGKDLRGVCKK